MIVVDLRGIAGLEKAIRAVRLYVNELRSSSWVSKSVVGDRPIVSVDEKALLLLVEEQVVDQSNYP